MNPRLRLLSVLLATAALALGSLLAAGPALAVRALAHGQGVMWEGDHASWIGSYLLDDGNTGYCLDVEKPQPAGTDVTYVDGSTTGSYSTADSARLAYISRNFGSPADPLSAASAQLATWTVAGLGGHDQAWFARRANDSAGDVVIAANHILSRADGPGGASTGVSATVSLELEGPGGSVRSELLVDYLAGRASVPAGSFSGQLVLTGATFADGSTSRSVPNGTSVPILPAQRGTTETVSVTVEYRALPFGPGFRLGRNTGPNQSLLVDHPYPRDARASTRATAPSELPFAPRVQTQTSAAIVQPGDALSDALHLDAHPSSPAGTTWGVYTAADGSLAPIPVVVTSVLHGPFPAAPVESETAPAGSPVVCTVETLAAAGPRRYDSPPCTVPSPGFYVWTDSIDPTRTPPAQGGTRLRPWTSRFGVAAETTLAPAAPTLSTTATRVTAPPPTPSPTPRPSAPGPHDLDSLAADRGPHDLDAPVAADARTASGVLSITAPTCIADSLHLEGLPPGIEPVEVRSTLLGPLPALPELESTPDDWRDFPVAGRTTTTLATDGDHVTACLPISTPGHYYFVTESDGSTPTSLPGAGTVAALVAPPTDDRAAATGADTATATATDADSATATEIHSDTDGNNDGASDASTGTGASTGGNEIAVGEPVDAALIPAFADHRVHASEAISLEAPPTAPPATTPPPASTAPPTPPAPPAPPAAGHLPLTGASAGPTAMATAVGIGALVLGLAIAGLAGTRIGTRRR
ncbi:hypothetical protein NVV95_09580 [Herbiconiux sp. CPCC 205716]|uniref:Gram-positive cocci surface proteins LPxTG domain-containing protein n=1 Tax=Herbiconiux gentiana TaxID=2970912 RepID=A0ABT2GF17_9MICO|nr:hypothetical protein [Herbiconiux gentiana]MCS5714800.1 hypothetical protein [Herbiconiux gentiana]